MLTYFFGLRGEMGLNNVLPSTSRIMLINFKDE